MQNNKQWTSGPIVYYLGKVGDLYRLSIIKTSDFAVLRRWYPNCGFTPLDSWHKTLDEAKQVGEEWLENPVYRI